MRAVEIVRGVLFFVTALTLTPLLAISAQDRPVGVKPGERVRVRLEGSQSWYTGNVVRVDADALILNLYKDEVSRVALSSVQRLQVSRGGKRHVGRSALIGGAAGVFFAGAVLAGAAAASGDGLALAGALILAPVFGVTGAFIGAAAGAASETEEWEDVPITRPLVSFDPHDGGALALGVSVRF